MEALALAKEVGEAGCSRNIGRGAKEALDKGWPPEARLDHPEAKKPKRAPVVEAAAVKVQEQARSMELAGHPAIAEALARGWDKLKDVKNGRNASRKMARQVILTRQHTPARQADSPEVQEANR